MRFRYSDVTATLALIVALGGTGAYAANQISSKDIRNGQVKNQDLATGSVTSAKVRDRTLLAKDFKSGELPKGATGDAGAMGPAGPTGPGGPQGPAGKDGAPTLPDVLPSGRTLRGAYAFSGTTEIANADGGISFPIALASEPSAVIVAKNTTSPTCTGSVGNPTAPAGTLCIYESTISDNKGMTAFSPQTGVHGQATKFGVGLFIRERSGPGSENKTSKGSWAVTAP